MATRYRYLTLPMAALLGSTTMLDTHAAEFLDGRVKIDIMLMQGFQSLKADSGAFNVVNTDAASGFHRLRFNLPITVQFNDWISGFVDLGEEPNDFSGPGGDFQISNDLSFIDISVLKAMGLQAAESNSLTLRLGNPVTTIFNYRGFSDGADVQGNPLIGNSPFDIVTAESGVQLIGEHRLDGSMLKGLGWDVSYTVPTFGENFSPQRGYDVFAKLRADFGALKLGAGYLRTDGEDQFNRNAVGGLTADSNLSTTEALFGDNENYNFPGTSTSARSTHQGLLPGVKARGWLLDAQFSAGDAALFRGWYGRIKDDFRFVDAGGAQTVRAVNNATIGRGDAEVVGYGIEGTYYLIPSHFYVAGRYTAVTNESSGVSGSPEMDRTQLGVGWWLHSTTLVKAEYVRQQEERNSPGQIGSDWDGFVLEISTRF